MHRAFLLLIVGHQAIYDVTKNSWTQKPCSFGNVLNIVSQEDTKLKTFPHQKTRAKHYKMCLN